MPVDPSSKVFVSPFAPGAGDRWITTRLGPPASGVSRAVRLSALGVAITWLPLFVLTLIAGRAFGANVTIPFLQDYVPHGRYLLALPLLLLLDLVVEHRTSLAIAHLRAADIVKSADQDRFRFIVEALARAWRNRIVLCVFVVLTYIVAAGSYFAIRELEVSNWMFIAHDGAVRPSAAGAWNLFVSAPLVRFLYLRAFWKLAVWAWFLVRVSRLDLSLTSLHPDSRCGLRFLGETQLAFTPMIAALGVQLGCIVALSVRFHGASLQSHKATGAAFVVLSLLLLVAPLCVFARRAWLDRELAEDGFGVWASLAARHLSTQLSVSRREHLPVQLATPEISSMTDASSLYDRVIATRPVPIDLRQITMVLAAATVSALLPLLTLLPLADIATRLMSMLL